MGIYILQMRAWFREVHGVSRVTQPARGRWEPWAVGHQRSYLECCGPGFTPSPAHTTGGETELTSPASWPGSWAPAACWPLLGDRAGAGPGGRRGVSQPPLLRPGPRCVRADRCRGGEGPMGVIANERQLPVSSSTTKISAPSSFSSIWFANE